MLPRVVLATLLSCSPVAAALAGQVATPDSARFATFLDSLLQAEQARAGSPGAVALAVLGGRVLHARGVGYADLERQVPIDPERTVFRVGSISKSLTAIAAMQLVEQGAVELHADVNEYLRAFEVPPRFDRPVTLFNLLTHTAGFEERLFGQHAARRSDWQPLGDFLANHFPRQVFPPGEIVGYNDYGSALAGLIVEEVSGRPFHDYVRQHVFEPLEMRRSSFRVESLPAEIAAQLATAYRRVGERYVPYEYDYIQTPPAAGLVTTAADMGRLLIATLGDGSRAAGVLSPETVRRLRSTAFTHHPLLRGRAYGYVVDRENDLEVLIKNGQATGFTARNVLVPERDFGLFVAQTRSILDPGGGFNDAARFASRMTSAVLDELFPPPESGSERVPPEGSEEGPPLERFTGTYRNVVGSWSTLESLASLFDEVRVRDNGDGTLAIGFGAWVRVAPDAFQWYEGHDAYRAFRLDERGEPTHLFIDAGAYRRLAWYETSTFTTRAAAVLSLLGLIAIGLAVAGRIRHRRNATATADTHAARLFTRLAVGAFAVLLVFLVSFGVVLSRTDPQRLFKGVTPVMTALLVLPIIGAALAGGAVGAGLAAWWRREGTGRLRLWYGVVTLGAVALLLILAQWNLVGFRY